jgi:hypothetical protein
VNLDQDVRVMLQERAERVAAAPVLPEQTVHRVRVRKAVASGGALAVVAIVAVTSAFLLRSTVWSDAAPLPPADRKEQGVEPPITTSHLATIDRITAAINARDTSAFIDTFGRGGVFNTRGDFAASRVLFDDELEVDQTDLVGAWMAINEAWGLEADVMACDELTNPRVVFGVNNVFVECEVRARWHNLSLEVIEAWNFEFDTYDNEGELLSWNLGTPATGYRLLELNPPDRTLPLGYDGLLAWEEWLKANQPQAATVYLNPRPLRPQDDCRGDCKKLLDGTGRAGPLLLYSAEKSWVVEGWRHAPDGYIPYDPRYADEIQASIQAYLGER